MNTVPPDTERAMAAGGVKTPSGVYLEKGHTMENNMPFNGMQVMIAVRKYRLCCALKTKQFYAFQQGCRAGLVQDQ